MRRIILTFSFCLLSILFSKAQQVDFSVPQRLNAKLNDFDILGKNSEGIIVLKFGRSDKNEVDAYSENMNLKWRKELSFNEKNAFIEKAIGLSDGIIIFYTVRTRDQNILFAQRLTENLTLLSQIKIDSFSSRKNNEDNVYTIRISKDKTKFLAYRTPNESAKISSISAMILDNNLQILWNHNLDVEDSYQAIKLEKSMIDNSGNIYFVFDNHSDRKKKQNEFPEKYSILIYKIAEAKARQFNIKAEGKFFYDSFFELDNANNTLAACGFYSEKSFNSFSGIFYFVLDLNNNIFIQEKYSPLPSELLTQLTGKAASEENKSELFDFGIKNLILRNDGGAILISEMFFKTIETRTVPNIYGNYSYIDYDYFHFNDIVAFSINNDGSVDWQNVMKKRQVSEEDGGYYSSFGMLVLRNELHFIFNEDIFKKTNIIDYITDNNGKTVRKNIMNTERKELMLMPRFSKQVSANEIIIPSLEGNYLRFARIIF